MILHLVKRLRVTTECVAGGRWAERGGITPGDLDGATIGIVGYGRIGRRVGHLARAFGMTVLAHDPYLADGAELVGLDELRARSNVVTLHLPLTPQTFHLVDAAFLAAVPEGTILVNCGRGGLLDLDAAARALADGRLAGLGLDVFDPEPPPPHPVFDRTDVVLSPHLMGLSAGATRATFTAAAQGVADVLSGRRPRRPRPPGGTVTSDVDRIAGAPISWGVCEVPGWGYQMPADQVLRQMSEVGLRATELGPDGFLPADPVGLATTLAEHDLHAVGGFTPFVLHRPDVEPMIELDRLLPAFTAARAGVMVLSADSGLSGYDSRPELEDDGWQRLLRNLDRVAHRAADHGVRAVLHPHVGTMVETGEDVQRVLDGSDIALCLDTGHLLIGGTDPAVLAGQVPDRIAHTHFKDVDLAYARKVREGRLTYTEAVREGMYRPLGTGDVDVAAIVGHLRGHGYDGWYTLEQDTILSGPPAGEGPVADVRTSVDCLRSLLLT